MRVYSKDDYFFSKEADAYSTRMDTGRTQVSVDIRFTEDPCVDLKVTLRGPDQRFGNAPSWEIAEKAHQIVDDINEQYGTRLRIAEIRYSSQNDAQGWSVRSLVHRIVQRYAEYGDIGFDPIFQGREHAEERWRGETERRCPECGSLCPEYRRDCLICEHRLGRVSMKDRPKF